jgi:hypothetical protein
MCIPTRLFGILLSLAAFVALGAGAPLRAQDAAPDWQVSKTSGEVWVATSGVQPASLGGQATVKPGDQIRTGRNGRVLLVRGQETILIAPNSAITLPETQKDAGSTTILQQAGSIKLEVDKRGERNFEVETPYLVAAVKGTQFTVTVSPGNAKVDVSHGSVEVADFKSGQIALVMPGQSAKVTSFGPGGLSLTGAGTLSPIRNGAPRAPSVQPLSVPKGGLSAPQGQQVRALSNPAGGQTQAPGVHARGGLHIGVALGEVKLDIHKVTNGLARDHAGAGHGNSKVTVWSNGDLLPGNGVAKTYNQGNSGSGNGAGGSGGGSSAGGGGSAGGSSGGGGTGSGSGGSSVAGVASGVGGVVDGAVSDVSGTASGTCNCAGNNGKHLGQLKH